MAISTTHANPTPASHAPAILRTGAWRAALWMTWGACALLGSFGLYQRLALGHLPAGYGSYVPWGLWIAIYFHGVGIAGGAFAVAGAGHLLGLRGFRHPAALRVSIVLAYASIVPAFIAVLLDLGHMERAHRILTSPSFTSMMAFNAWMYAAFLVVATACFFLSYRPGSGWLKPLLCLGILLAVMFPSQSGAFFGVVDAKPHWHNALLPIMFLASSITAGAALLLLIRGLIGVDSPAGIGDSDPASFIRALGVLRIVVMGGLIAYFVLEFAEFSVAMWNTQTHAPALDLILFGPYWWVFWIVHLALGGVLPLALLASRRPGRWIAAGALVAVTFISARLNVLVPGQAMGELRGLQDAFHHPRLDYTYHATAMEYFVGLLLVAVGMTIFYGGRRFTRWLSRTASVPQV